MKTPKTSDLDKVLATINEIAKASVGVDYIYRGESKHYKPIDKISSSLYREYREIIEAKHFDIAVVQEEILTEAKEYTLHKMEDFELLATLQHHGDRTNLIDFTTDYLVALFFACEKESGEPGRVILLQKQSEAYTVKNPPKTIRRAEIQKSIFVQSPNGVVKPDRVVCIPAELKSPLLEYLRRHHDISTKTIYNDLQGFIEKRGLHKSAYTEFYKGLTCHARGDSSKIQAEKEKWYDDAIAYYTETVRLNSEFAIVYYNRGVACYDTGDFPAAIADYSKAIELTPEDADAYYNRGFAYGATGDFPAAITDYSKVIELTPEDADAYKKRGFAYYDTGDFPAAIADYSKVIELTSEDADVYFFRGFAYGATGDFPAAIADYSKAIELDPEDADAKFFRGVALLPLRDWEKAKDDLTAAKDMGADIVTLFHYDYKTVEDFEDTYEVKLPEDIAALLRGE